MKNTSYTDKIKEELINEIEFTFNALVKGLSAFDSTTINTGPFEGSWTAGQTAEHIIKSSSGIPDSKTTESNRSFDEKVQPVRELFLNFDIKFEADNVIAPGSPPHEKSKLIATIEEIKTLHKRTAQEAKMTALCLDMELPTFGHLTRYEWLKFILFHTQRHTHQLENIHNTLTLRSA